MKSSHFFTLILCLLIVLEVGCTKEKAEAPVKEGCKDPFAENYSYVAEIACDTCCIYDRYVIFYTLDDCCLPITIQTGSISIISEPRTIGVITKAVSKPPSCGMGASGCFVTFESALSNISYGAYSNYNFRAMHELDTSVARCRYIRVY